jgi:tRNA threonylcarbamoyladenosine biosynthesis protein TsaB
MKLLALDTSSLACSVALQIGNQVYERHEVQPREHTRLLIPMIGSVVQEAGVQLTELDAIVLGNGPGSFIGMRIAASVAQGLAFGSGLKIVPVSSLAAVAAQVFAEQDATEVVVAQDAHMNEVYLGRYTRGEHGLPKSIVAECLHGKRAIPQLQDEPGCVRVAAGSGWQRYPELLEANQAGFDDVVDVLHPTARYLLALGASDLVAGGAIEPEEVMPAYLREKVAQVPSRS